ncbi:MAG: hypothetical protein IIU08_08955 [Clostridia bacterium]|nr:hypothetical protein [Clostridia bacterium]
MRIRIWLALVLAGVLFFTGCGDQGGLHITPSDKGDSGDPGRVGVLTGVYRGKEIPLPDTFRLTEGAVRIDAAGYVTFCAGNADGQTHLLTLSGEGDVTEDLLLNVPEDSSVSAGAFGENCYAYLTAVRADRRTTGETLHLCDFETGEVRMREDVRAFFSTADMQEGENGGFRITSLAVDADGDIWLGSPLEIVVLSPEFSFVTSFVSRGYYAPLCAAPDGSVWVPADDGVRILDRKTGGESALRFGDRPSGIAFGDGYDFFYETDAGVFGWNGTERVLLMDFQNSGIIAGNSRLRGVLDAENLLFTEADGRLMIYMALGDIDLSSVPTIEIAASAFGASMANYSFQIVEYNKSHPETRVILTDYTQYNTNENLYGGTQKLTTDLVTGKIKPDIVIASPRSYHEPDLGAEIEQMLKNRLYRDLTPFLESDPALNPENLFGAVRRYFTAEDGGMWGIASTFQVSTLYGPTSLLEKWSDRGGSSSGWTLTELLDFADSMPEGSYLIGGLFRETAAQRLLGPDGYAAFIDRKSASASFDSPEFLRWLNFLASLPKAGKTGDSNTPDLVGLRQDTAEYYYTGRVALETGHLELPDQAVELMEAEFGTKDWTIVGFPAEGRNGAYVQCEAAILMTDFCTEEALAWDVIRTLVTGFDVFLPIAKQTYEERAAECIERGDHMMLELTHDAGGWGRTTKRRSAPDGNFPTLGDLGSPGWVSVPTAEDFARFEAFLDNDAGYPLTERLDPEITGIISEEISAFLSGVDTAEDCAKKIQSRVSIWLAEHS